MTRDWGDDNEDIVVDDKPREDGLNTEVNTSIEPARNARSPEQLEVPVTSIPQILEMLQELAQQQAKASRSVEKLVTKSHALLKRSLDELMQRLVGLEESLGDFFSKASAQPVDVSEKPALGLATTNATSQSEIATLNFVPVSDELRLEQLVFGKELSETRSLTQRRRELLDCMLERDSTAIGLAARLMLARAATAEELPTLLKEIGEAYYRRHPKTADVTDTLETLLVEDLDRCIAAVGLRNSIELVRLGDRYDATRHVSADRGVEVSEVRGWAVLRENGKPLTKASVGLR